MGKYSLKKKTGKNFCDDLWRRMVKIKFNNKCPVCDQLGIVNEEDNLNAHHLISRRVYKYRWDTDNGFLLCPKHHEFDLYISAHTAPWAIEYWIQEHMPEKYKQWVINRKDLTSEGKYKYEEIYHELEKEYKELTGEYFMIKRINMYLLSLHKSEIMVAKNFQSKSVPELAKKYSVTDGVMKKFLAM